MTLVIDIGNTSIKIGLFENDNLKINISFHHAEFESKLKQIAKSYKVNRAFVSSVVNISVSNKEVLFSLFKCKILSNDSKLPFHNLYATPLTLGVDRIALAAAASSQFPLQNVLVIDAGTCITYDFVNNKSEYLGGAIAPGINSRYKALHDYTANLPLIEKQYPTSFIGNSTINSIHSGVVNGIAREIDGIIDQYNAEFEKLTIVLTGGDASFLAKQLKSNIFVKPFFLLEGLHIISKLNFND